MLATQEWRHQEFLLDSEHLPSPITTKIVSFFLIKQTLRVGLTFNHQARHRSYGKTQLGF